MTPMTTNWQRTSLFAVTSSLLCLLPAQVRAQTTGYEDYQKSYEAQKSDLIGRASGGMGVTLADKRAAATSVPFANSLRLLRQALSKGIVFSDGELAESARMRQMLRVLLVESYVLFADGRTRTALDTLRDGYALADVTRTQPTGTFSAALTGYALDNALAFTYAHYLPQLSQRDCIDLQTFLKRRLTAPESFSGPLDQERVKTGAEMDRWIEAAFAHAGNDLGAAQTPDLPQDLQLSAGDLGALLKWRDSAPARMALHAEAGRQLDAVYAHATDLLRQPAGVEFTEAPPSVTTNAQVVRVAHSFVAATRPQSLYWDCELYVLDRAYLGLFYISAALRSYWWEHGRYPDSLDELHLGPETNDPFTGKPFLYHLGPDVVNSATGKPAGVERPNRVAFTYTDPETGKDKTIQPPDKDHCTLLSAGPFLRSEYGKAPGETRKRQALSLTGLSYTPPLPGNL